MSTVRLSLCVVAAVLVAGCGAGGDTTTSASPTAAGSGTAPPVAGMCAASEPDCEDTPEAPTGSEAPDLVAPPGDASDGGAAGACLEGATECADDPSASGPPLPPEGTAVEPHEGLVEVAATAWEQVVPVDTEQTVLEVQWFGGNEACFGLDRVEVDEGDDAVTITVFTGREPDAQVCTMEAVLKSTEVELSEPLGPRSILDGAEG